MTTHSFSDHVNDQRQKQANKICCQYWKEVGYEVIDISENPNYYNIRIDLIRKIADEQTTIDVKCDFQAHRTGNVVCELIEIADEWGFQKLGSVYNQNLDEFNYYIWETKELLIFPRKQFLFIAFSKERRGYAAYHEKPKRYFTLGVLIPIKELREQSWFKAIQL